MTTNLGDGDSYYWHLNGGVQSPSGNIYLMNEKNYLLVLNVRIVAPLGG